MKLWQRIVLVALNVLALIIGILAPLYTLVDKLIIGKHEKAKISFITVIVIAVFTLIIISALKNTIKRRLQSIDVADELGINGSTPIILKRVLLSLQIIVPIGLISLFLYGMTFIPTIPYKLFLGLIWWLLGAFVILIIHDYLKKFFRDEMLINKALKLDKDKEQKLAKQKQKLESKKQKKDKSFIRG